MNKLFLLIVLIYLIIYVQGNSIDFLSKFDEVSYDSKALNEFHNRVSRSLDSHLYINFNSFGKDFRLKLSPSKSYFEHDYIELDNKKYSLNDYKFYKGELVDDPDSHVSGSIIDGVFYGTIKTKNGYYHIESTKRYNGTFKSHSLIYHEKDLLVNNTVKKRDLSSTNNHIGCASEKIFDWMKKIQKDAFDENIKNQDFETYYTYLDNQYDFMNNRYTKEANLNNRTERKKRAAEHVYFPNNKSVCNLYLKVDPILYKEIYQREGSEDHSKTIDFITNYLHKHVESLNSIFEILQFYNADKTKYYIGVRFSIHRTRIITHEMCSKNRTSLIQADQNLCEQYLDVQTFLNYMSLDNYTNFCLAYGFTARDFADGTLGLAWVAKPGVNAGGICERHQSIQGTLKSLNSGIVTVINYGARVPDLVSHITFAHEVGHNFGAEHDPDICVPGEKNGGNYIMYSRATTGQQKNNRIFSDCSRDSMGKVLFSIVSPNGNTNPKFCFEANTGPLCGNLIVEEGEECDCGFSDECQEKCCYSAESNNKCKLKFGYNCSPSQGPCCTSECEHANSTVICSKSTECLKDVYCDGYSSYCPKNNSQFFINFSENGTTKDCNDGTQICKGGICTGSICEKYNMIQCYLEGNLKDKNIDKERLCHLACQGEPTNNVCVDSFEINLLLNPKQNSSGFILKPGSACAGTQGYCDIFSKCRAVDAEGPLSRLKNMIFNPGTLKGIKQWVTDYWWGVVLISIGVIIFMGLFIKVCSVHTPSSNPRKPPALKFTDTIRRPMKRYRTPAQAGHRAGISNATNNTANYNNNKRKINIQKPTKIKLKPTI